MLNSTHWVLQCTETAGNMADTISFSKSVVLSRNDQISPSSPSPIKNLLVGLQSLEPDSILSVPYQQSCTPQLVKKKKRKKFFRRAIQSRLVTVLRWNLQGDFQ